MQAKKINAMMHSCKGSKRMQQADCDWAKHDSGAHHCQINYIPMQHLNGVPHNLSWQLWGTGKTNVRQNLPQ